MASKQFLSELVEGVSSDAHLEQIYFEGVKGKK